jgi:Tfp pilus assembly PilM family ATPase
MCAAVERAASEDDLRALDAAGLEPVALEPRAWALRRAALAIGAQPAGAPAAPAPLAIVEIAWAHALVVVADDNAVLYQRTLTDAGLGTVRGALAASSGDEDAVDLALSRVGLNDPSPEDEALPPARAALAAFAESLGGELRASLAYAQHRFGVSTGVLFAGAGAEVPGLCEALSLRAGAPGAPAECPGGPAMLAALGLALHDPEDAP